MGEVNLLASFSNLPPPVPETPVHCGQDQRCPQHIPSLSCNGPGRGQEAGPLSLDHLGAIAKRVTQY